MAFAMIGATFLFLVGEYVRYTRLPPFGHRMHDFMKVYIDKRDCGELIVTHLYLLVGCALPVWFHFPVYELDTSNQVDVAPALSGVLILGVGDSIVSILLFYPTTPPFVFPLFFPLFSPSPFLLSNYFFFSAFTSPFYLQLPFLCMCHFFAHPSTIKQASLFGSYLGRTRWPKTRKTLEGTAGAIVGIFTTCYLLQLAFGDVAPSVSTPLVVSTICVCLLESFTDQIDNLFLPLYYYSVWIVVRGRIV